MLSRTLLLLSAAIATAAAADCGTAPYASCGSDAGTSCCPGGYYCQPWSSDYYQCVQPPSQCSQQLTNVDLYGDDLTTLYGIQPSECCAKCAQTAGCKAYTFINSNPGSPACYLKSGFGTRQTKTGAVSGIINGSTNTTTPTPTPTSTPTPTPTPTSSTCSTAAYASCGSSAGTTCCPSGYYCQPWNSDFYQCIQPPSRCSKQATDTDFYGNDIATVYVSLPSLCCDACANTTGCKAYTYINNNPGQPVCYLKSAAGTPSRYVGAVSGKLS